MPCYDPRDREDDDHMRLGAALLCEAIKSGFLETTFVLGGELSIRIAKWQAEHKERDR